ncbi:MAG: ABC transporter permease [Bacteroidota bacterium]
MLHLLKLEWLKIQKHSTTQILLILYVIALPTLLLAGKSFNDLPQEFINRNTFYMFPTVWQYLGYIGNWISFFVFGFIAVMLVTTEYQNRTMRQNIITGLQRREYFLSKVYFILAASLVGTLYYVICGLLFGLAHTETLSAAKMMQNTDLIPRYFLMLLSYMTFGLFIGTVIRKTGVSLFLYLAWAFFLERIVRYSFHQNIFPGKSIHFYPVNAASDLVPFNSPLNRMAEEYLEQNNFSLFLSPTEAVITSALYIAVFLFICYRLIQQRDL